MKLVSRFAAASLSTAELRGLLRKAFTAAATVAHGSQEHRDALASMRNIREELAMRPPGR